jgi:hypothetical protein
LGYFQLSVDYTFFWMFAFGLFFWNVPGRIAIGCALLCLVSIVILLALANYTIFTRAQTFAEVVAIWTYFFLIIGVLKQVFEMRYHAEGVHDSESKTSNQLLRAPHYANMQTKTSTQEKQYFYKKISKS